MTERVSLSSESNCTAIIPAFDRADVIAVLLFFGGVLALSGAPRQLSQRESLGRSGQVFLQFCENCIADTGVIWEYHENKE